MLVVAAAETKIPPTALDAPVVDKVLMALLLIFTVVDELAHAIANT